MWVEPSLPALKRVSLGLICWFLLCKYPGDALLALVKSYDWADVPPGLILAPSHVMFLGTVWFAPTWELA